MLNDDRHCITYAKIWAFSDPRFPTYGQNRMLIFPFMARICDAGKCGSEKARIFAYFTQCIT